MITAQYKTMVHPRGGPSKEIDWLIQADEYSPVQDDGRLTVVGRVRK